jgi:hypothetical protein
MGILRNDRVQQAVEERVGGGGGRHEDGDSQPVPTRCSPHSAINVGLNVPKIAGTEKGGGGPLLLHHVIEVRGRGSGIVHWGEAAGRFDQLDKLVTVPPSPLVSKWTSESGAKGEGLTKLIEIQHRG